MPGSRSRPAETPAAAGAPARGTCGGPDPARPLGGGAGRAAPGQNKGREPFGSRPLFVHIQENAGALRRCQPHYRAAGRAERDISDGGHQVRPWQRQRRAARPVQRRRGRHRTMRTAAGATHQVHAHLARPPGCYAAIVVSSSGFFHDATLLSICVWQSVQLGSNPAWHVSNGDALRQIQQRIARNDRLLLFANRPIRFPLLAPCLFAFVCSRCTTLSHCPADRFSAHSAVRSSAAR